jgi:hypothetical protein
MYTEIQRRQEELRLMQLEDMKLRKEELAVQSRAIDAVQQRTMAEQQLAAAAQQTAENDRRRVAQEGTDNNLRMTLAFVCIFGAMGIAIYAIKQDASFAMGVVAELIFVGGMLAVAGLRRRNVRP